MGRQQQAWREHFGFAEPAPEPQVQSTQFVTLTRGYGAKALEDEYQTLLHAPDGRVNYQTNRAGFCLGQLVAGGELDAETVLKRMTHDLPREKWGEPADDTHVRSFESGFEAGKLEPRSAPRGVSRDVKPADTSNTDDLEALVAQIKADMLTSADLENLPSPVPLIDGLVFLDSLVFLIADPGAGKSLTALDWAGCIGTGSKWHGRSVHQGGVLYMVGEGATGIKPRVRAWEDRHGSMIPDAVEFLPYPLQADSDQWEAFTLLAERQRPAMIVVDTLAMSTVGRDENNAGDMGVFVDGLHKLRRASGAAVVVVHHAGKSGTMRGSTALQGAATTVVRFAHDDGLVTLSTSMKAGGKQKDAPPLKGLSFRITQRLGSVVLEPEESSDDDLRALGIEL